MKTGKVEMWEERQKQGQETKKTEEDTKKMRCDQI